MKRQLFALLILLLLSSGLVRAQNYSDDLIAYVDGDLWAWSPQRGAMQLTTHEYNGGAVISPDASMIAYESVANEAKPQLESGNGFALGGAVPKNIWTMQISNRDFERIALQNNSANILRSYPVWSPDSQKVAWTQVIGEPNLGNASLVMYDMRSNETTNLTSNFSMGFQDGGLSMVSVNWGAGGISRILFSYGEAGVGQSILEIYDPNNVGAVQSFLLADERNAALVFDHVWVNNGRDFIAMVDTNGNWSLFDPVSGGRQGLQEPPLMTNRAGNLGVRPRRVQVDDFIYQYEWVVERPNTGIVTTLPYRTFGLNISELPALSPDGTAVAWREPQGNVIVYNLSTQTQQTIISGSTEVHRFVRPLNVVWDATRWVTNFEVVTPLPVPTQPPIVNTCSMPPRATVGQQVVITPGTPNNVRANPTTSARVTNVLSAGTGMSVIDGPVCANGYQWFKVSFAGGQGWTAEGSNGNYWLTPVNNYACSNSPAPRLREGDAGYVLPGDPNALRDNPGTGSGSSVISNIPGGASFTVIGAAVCGNEGRRWYPILYNGQYGWTAEGEGSTYWIAPQTNTATCSNSPTPRLTVGGYGMITPGLPNVIRNNANTGSSMVIGQIPAGGVFYITGAGVCGANDGRLWYPIIYNGLSGWTAEGEGNTYWTAPN